MATTKHMSDPDLATLERQIGIVSERDRVLTLIDETLSDLRMIEHETDSRGCSTAHTRGKINVIETLKVAVRSGRASLLQKRQSQPPQQEPCPCSSCQV